jgi:hypothetical protein
VPVIASCVAPWGIQGSANDPAIDYGLDETLPYVFQLSAGDWNTPGNYGALAIYGGGTSQYRAAIEGSCGDQVACDSDSPYVAIGDTLSCSSQTGALGKNTATALKNRLPSSTWATCDVETDADGYLEAQAKAELPECRDRAVPISIIDAFPPQGQSADVEIWGLATFYIADWDRDPPYGDGDLDGDPDGGMVWGYLVPGTSLPVWIVEWGWDSDNPFSPEVIVLVE